MYNFLCSALSLYSLAVIVKSFYQGGVLYTFAMVPDRDVKHAFFIYLITKHLELLDTVFMILRHRQRQITFLHVSLSLRQRTPRAFHHCNLLKDPSQHPPVSVSSKVLILHDEMTSLIDLLSVVSLLLGVSHRISKDHQSNYIQETPPGGVYVTTI